MKFNLWPPSLILTSESIPASAGGDASYCWVRLRASAQNDKAMLTHELEHVWQFWMLALLGLPIAGLMLFLDQSPWIGLFALTFHKALYRTSMSYKLYCEVKAYKAQIVVEPDDRTLSFARALSSDYGEKITVSDALKLLKF